MCRRVCIKGISVKGKTHTLGMASRAPWFAGFWSLVLCRMAVGVGEASFVSLAAPFIGAAAALWPSWTLQHSKIADIERVAAHI